ncbi:hypothetical protein ACQ5SP_11710 [Rhodovulum sp. YNF3179]|uniref:hypothetical protein n=1 Tax=Rhodovulum sp. YNF3179 TaxID=3425127 RepID=UPI003D32A734
MWVLAPARVVTVSRRAMAGFKALLRGGILFAWILMPEAPAVAQAFLEDTVLADIGISRRSESARSLSWGETQLSDGTSVPFEPWYSSDWRDLRVTLLTLVDENFGILWGLGTGERGEKYEIEPSVTLGFIRRFDLSRNSSLTLRLSYTHGGDLQEKTCRADYGDIGGIQTVNCRLAATPLPPRDTLQYLVDEPPGDQLEAAINYVIRF